MEEKKSKNINNLETKQDKCPYCGKEVTITLNIPFFGDQRICAECSSGYYYTNDGGDDGYRSKDNKGKATGQPD